METIIYEIEFKNGRIFKVFCANSNQKKSIIETYNKMGDKMKDIREITNGIHTTKQFLDMCDKNLI